MVPWGYGEMEKCLSWCYFQMTSMVIWKNWIYGAILSFTYPKHDLFFLVAVCSKWVRLTLYLFTSLYSLSLETYFSIFTALYFSLLLLLFLIQVQVQLILLVWVLLKLQVGLWLGIIVFLL